jgi:hypothetical protein
MRAPAVDVRFRGSKRHPSAGCRSLPRQIDAKSQHSNALTIGREHWHVTATTGSKRRKQSLIFSMRANKEPNDCVWLRANADGTVRGCNPHRPHGERRVHLLELEAWMGRIRHELAVRECGPFANRLWQPVIVAPERLPCTRLHIRSGSRVEHSPRSSSAITSETSVESAAVWISLARRHSRSSLSSCSTNRATDSCSTSGSWRSFSITSSKTLIIECHS